MTFLTAVPIGRRTEIGARELRRGTVFFPLVGAVVGAMTAGVAWVAALALPPLPAAVLGVAAGVAVTGAMHLDGLADTADGVGAALSGGDPSTAMHDPRFGVFGGAAIVLDLLLKVSVLSVLVAGSRFPFEVIAAGALGRAAAIVALGSAPYAGGASGTGAWTRGIGLGRCLVAVAVALAIGLVTAGVALGAMVIAVAIAVALISRWSRRHLGGMTGDTLGATIELSETLALVAALAGA